jgi:hypothetical protein
MLTDRAAGPPPELPQPAARVVRPVRHWWRMHPRLGLALRTSIAGGLAWAVAKLLPGHEAQQHAYFAPMGAVVVTSTTVLATARELFRSVLALTLGSAVGLLALAIVRPDAVSVAVVIAASVLIAGWKLLGTMRAWVPTVAIFTMVLGQGQPLAYATAYTGLTSLGAAIGVAVVTLMPQLITAPLDEAVHRLWLSIIERLGQLQDDLRDGGREASFGTGLPDTVDLDTVRRRVETRLAEASEAQRIRRRSRRADLDARLAQARAVHRVALRLQDLQRRLEDLADPQETGRPDEPAEFECRVADAIESIRQALQRGSVGDRDQSLEQALTTLDEKVASLPTRRPGLHMITPLVDDLRRLGMAAGEAVRLTVASTD